MSPESKENKSNKSDRLNPDLFRRVFKKIDPYKVLGIAFLIHASLYIGTGFFVNRYISDPLLFSFLDPPELIVGGINFFFIAIIWGFYQWFPRASIESIKELEKENLIATSKQQQQLSNLLKTNYNSRWIVISSFLASTLFIYLYWREAIPTQIESLGKGTFWLGHLISKIILSVVLLIAVFLLAKLAFHTITFVFSMRLYFIKGGRVKFIYLSHPDTAGGFGVLGSLIRNIIWLTVIAGIWAMAYTFYPLTSGGDPLYPSLLIVTIVYIIVVPFILWGILLWPRKAMLAYKDNRLKRIAIQIQKRENKSFASLNDKKASIKHLKKLKLLHSHFQLLESDLSSSPISNYNLRRFSLEASIPILLSLVSLAQQFFQTP